MDGPKMEQAALDRLRAVFRGFLGDDALGSMRKRRCVLVRVDLGVTRALVATYKAW